IYGHSLREDPVEIVNYRVSAVGLIDKITRKKTPFKHKYKTSEPQYANVIFDGVGVEVPVYHRSELEPGFKINEPAIIGEMGATTVIYPGQEAIIDDSFSIIIYTNSGEKSRRLDLECETQY
ncbi:MAG: hypothetical protein K6T88_07015, partial [Bacillus sp. (in: Bacteria)]|nr:hypothetical protein [Bacillus sp. (in: firmicutes)]